jgi:DNA modification methylase
MSREIVCADAIKWLEKQADHSLPNVVTGICDLDEISLDMTEYLKFFRKAADLICRKVKKDGYAIFIQTDRKYQRQWIDKSHLITNIALNNGLKMVWHKIVLLREVGRTDLHRPTYSHMLCYTVNGRPGAATPDVIPVSQRSYKNATPIEAAGRAIRFIAKNSPNKGVVDPFVGRGTVVALANKAGLYAIGIDIDPAQAEHARKLEILIN